MIFALKYFLLLSFLVTDIVDAAEGTAIAVADTNATDTANCQYCRYYRRYCCPILLLLLTLLMLFYIANASETVAATVAAKNDVVICSI